MALNLVPKSERFGAEVSGIDLRQQLDDKVREEIAELMDRYLVLCFRGQPLTDDELCVYGANFGTLNGRYGNGDPKNTYGYTRPELSAVTNLDATGQIMARSHHRHPAMMNTLLWHTDSAWVPDIDKYTMLLSRKIPSSGGETQFADLRAAYDALPKKMQRELDDIVVMHDWETFRTASGDRTYSDRERNLFPPVPKPLVVVNAGTGRKSLYLGMTANYIQGRPVEEGKALLKELLQHAGQGQFVITHEWGGPGELIVWDNRQVMHRRKPWNHEKEVRIMRRLGVGMNKRLIDEYYDRAKSASLSH